MRAADLLAAALERVVRNRVYQIESMARSITTVNFVNGYFLNLGTDMPELARINKQPTPLAGLYSLPHRKLQPERVPIDSYQIELTGVEQNR